MVKLAEIDPTTQAITHYEGSRMHTAVRQAAEQLQARPCMPALGDRLLTAMDLLLTGKVTYQGHGFYQVQSGSHSYRIHPEDGCPCKFAEHQSQWCKHALAVALHQESHRLLALARRGEEEPAPEPEAAADGFSQREREPGAQPQPPAAPGWHDQEPGFVHSLRWTDAATGVEHMTVVRSDSLGDLWDKVKQVSAMIKTARQRAEASQADRVAEAPAPRSALEASCPDHGTSRLKPSKYGDGVFCAGKSPRQDGSFCAYSWKPQA